MYCSPLEQFEPIPYLFPFQLNLFYIFGTNVTLILILLTFIYLFLNGSFWSILIDINFFIKSLYTSIINGISLFKLHNVLRISSNHYFYRSLYSVNSFRANCGNSKIVLIRYLYSIASMFNSYNLQFNLNLFFSYLNLNYFSNINKLFTFNYLNFNLKKIFFIRNIFLYLLKNCYLFIFFFKRFFLNFYNIFLTRIFSFGLNTVVTTFLTSNLKKSLKYFPFFLSIFSMILAINVIGIIPYSSTVSSYLCITLFLTLIILISAYFIVFSLHGIFFF